MPPRKKQAPEQQHAEEQPAPITRLLACDDLLGKVYSSCEDAATRHALRVSCSACYRSPAINSFIDTFAIGPHTSPESTASALAAFPRPARIRSLTIQENHIGDLKPIIQHLLGPAPEASAARAKLQCVDTIHFNGCDLDALDMAALLLLFPVVRSDHGRIQLTGELPVSGGVLGILAAQSCVNELKICQCLPSTLHELASFRSLKSLALVGVTGEGMQGPVSLEPLCAGTLSAGPQLQLTKLQLIDLIDVTGLDVCLACHPLQELQLIGVYFPPSLASTRLASSTLRVMCMWLNLILPDISAENFPALHLLEIQGTDLKQIPGMNAEESVQRCTRLASSIAEFPCVQFCYRVDSSDSQLVVWGDARPGAQFLELLQCLAPLRPYFQSVKYLGVMGSNFGCGAMRVVATLFPNLVWLRLCTQKGEQTTYSDEFGLSEAVQFPDLKELQVVCGHVPQDVLRALSMARQGFVLVLAATNDGCCQRLDEMKRQWDVMRLEHQDGPWLNVMSMTGIEDESEEEEAEVEDVPEEEA